MAFLARLTFTNQHFHWKKWYRKKSLLVQDEMALVNENDVFSRQAHFVIEMCNFNLSTVYKSGAMAKMVQNFRWKRRLYWRKLHCGGINTS